MSRLYCCLVIISQPLGTKLTLGQPSKPLLDTTGSLVIYNWHYWGIIIVTVHSTNLAGWAPVFTNTTPTNVLFYTDPYAGSFPTRFYRAFQFP